MHLLIALGAAGTAGALEAVVATTFELLPERVDLVGFVLQSAGFLGLLAVAAGRASKLKPRQRENLAEIGTVVGAGFGLVGFFVLLVLQEVG